MVYADRLCHCLREIEFLCVNILHIVYHISIRLIDKRLESGYIVLSIAIIIEMIEVDIGNDGNVWPIGEKCSLIFTRLDGEIIALFKVKIRSPKSRYLRSDYDRTTYF